MRQKCISSNGFISFGRRLPRQGMAAESSAFLILKNRSKIGKAGVSLRKLIVNSMN